jgi:hypothetical protein
VDEQEESGFDSRQKEEFFLFAVGARLTLRPHIPRLLREQLASSSVSDVDSFVTIRKLLDYIFNILPVFVRRWGILT